MQNCTRWRLRLLSAGVWVLIPFAELQSQSGQPVTLDSAQSRPIGRLDWHQDGVRNHTLGFMVPYPGPGFLVPADEQARLTALSEGTKGAMAFWVFLSETHEVTIIFQVVNNGVLGRDTTELRSFARGVRGSANGRVLDESLIALGAQLEYSVNIERDDATFYRMRCLGSGSERSEPILVCVTTVAPEYSALDELRRGLSLMAPVGR